VRVGSIPQILSMKKSLLLAAVLALSAFSQGQAQSAPASGATGSVPENNRRATQLRLLASAERAAATMAKSDQPSAVVRDAVFAEAKYRLLAAMFADEATVRVSDIARTEGVAKRLDLEPAQRYELSRLVAAAKDKGRKHGSLAAWRVQREKDAVRLWREFPEVPDAGAVLLDHAARAQPKRMAELAAMVEGKATVAAVKERAQALRVRAALDGANLFSALLEVKGGSALAKECTGRPVVFYTWSPRDFEKRPAFFELLSKAPQNALVIGIASGTDPGRSGVGAPAALPGRQLYGGHDGDSPLAKRLTLTEPGLVLLADSSGTMRLFYGEANPSADITILK